MRRALLIVVALALVSCSGPTFEANDDIPTLALRFDGWPVDATAQATIDPRQATTFRTDWTSRTPVGGYSMYGSGVDAQAHENQNIQWASSRGIDGFVYLCITPAEIYHATADTDPIREDISIPYNAFKSSPYKNRMKFALLLQGISLRYPYPGFPGHPANSTDGGAYLTQWASYVATQLADPQYLQIQGRPMIGLYASPDMPTAMWTTFVSALQTDCGCNPIFTDWQHSNSDAVRLGEAIKAAYPPNPWIPNGTTQHAYSEQAALDVAGSGVNGTLTTAVISTLQDARALTHTVGTDPTLSYVDAPTMPEFAAHLKEMWNVVSSGFRPVFRSIHAWNEWAEDGNGLAPSNQEGYRFLDQIDWQKHPEKTPPAYTYGMSPEALTFTRGGSGWSLARMLGASNASVFNNAEMVDSTGNDTLSLNHVAWQGAAIYGSTASGLGTFEVSIDGAPVATVSQAAGSTTRHVRLWSKTFDVEKTHTVSLRVVSGTVRVDEFEVTTNPQHFVSGAVAPPTALPTDRISKAMAMGQSNAVGQGTRIDPEVNIPFYPRYLDEYVGYGPGIFQHLGAVTRDIPVTAGNLAALGNIVTKRGIMPGVGAALFAGGKNPIEATIARSGTAISYFATGQPGQIAWDTYADELVTAVGSSNWNIIVVWGESDAQATGTGNAWQTNLTAWVAHMRVKLPGARVYVVQLHSAITAAGAPAVRTGNTAFVAGDGNAELLDPETCTMVNPHYTDAGYDCLAAIAGARVLATGL